MTVYMPISIILNHERFRVNGQPKNRRKESTYPGCGAIVISRYTVLSPVISRSCRLTQTVQNRLSCQSVPPDSS